MKVRVLALALTAVLVALVAVTAAGARQGQSRISGKISIIGIWTGPEQKNFEAVIAGFKKLYPNVSVKYTSGGDNTPTILSTAVQGGNPPDLASVAQPGLIKQFADRKALKPIEFARDVIARNYSKSWLDLGTINGKLYGLVFKGANKSTVWYSATAFKNAGIKAPGTWTSFLKDAKTIKSSGTPAYSIGAADGWTLTDLFENIYLRQAGVADYDRLTKHHIKWTDPSVKAALRTMAQVVGDTGNIYGGTSGALQTDFPTSVNNMFSLPPKAAMVIEGDFVPGVATTKAVAVKDYNQFAFPSIKNSPPSVVKRPSRRGDSGSLTSQISTPSSNGASASPPQPGAIRSSAVIMRPAATWTWIVHVLAGPSTKRTSRGAAASVTSRTDQPRCQRWPV